MNMEKMAIEAKKATYAMARASTQKKNRVS